MLVIDRFLQDSYSQLLFSCDVPESQHVFYQEWLRIIFEFCSDYQQNVQSPQSSACFLEEPSEKNQPPHPVNQTYHVVRQYQQSLNVQSKKENKVKNSPDLKSKPHSVRRKQNIPEKPKPNRRVRQEEGSLHGCSWKDEYKALKEAIHIRRYSPKTLKSYSSYVRKFQAYTQSLDPQKLSAEDVKDFLTHLAAEKKVSTSTQNLAFNALLFFFRHVLKEEFGDNDGVVRAKKRPDIPVVLSKEEIDRIIRVIEPQYQLIIKLLYGCGLRLFECLNLKVQCLNFDAGILTVHDGKGQEDRAVPIPQVLLPELLEYLPSLKELHFNDLEKGYDGVFLPESLDRKYRNESREFTWQWLFPSKQLTLVKKSNERRRSHLHVTHVQKALRQAVGKLRLTKRVTPHTFRHSFASHLLQNNYDIYTIQELLGHSDVRTTMIYTHTVKSVTKKTAKSPLDF